MTMPPDVEVATRSHVGHVRRRNEDAFYQGQWLYAVADGLGGHVAGDVASTTAIEALRAYDRPVPAGDLVDVLGRAIRDADDALRRKVREDPRLAGMGTTMVAVLRSGGTAALANIGDSRAYLMRGFTASGTRLTRLSEDHTYRHLVAGAAVVPSLPEKLTRFLDGRPDGRSPDLSVVRLLPGDRVLLCSDGLSSFVPHDIMQRILGSLDTPSVVADELITAALGRGGHDNVTVMIIET